MYLAGYIVAGLHRRRRLRVRVAARAGATATTAPALVVALTLRRARRARAGRRRRLGRPRGRRDAAGQARRVRGPAADREGRAVHDRRLLRRGDGEVTYGIEIPKLLSLLAYHDPNATVQGLDSRAAATTARRSTSCASRSRRWSGSARCSRCSASLFVAHLVCAGGDCRARAWFYRAVVAAGPLSLVALIAGWVTTEVGRQPWIVYEVDAHDAGGDARRRARGRLRRRWSPSTSRSAARVVWLLRRLARSPPEPRSARRWAR